MSRASCSNVFINAKNATINGDFDILGKMDKRKKFYVVLDTETAPTCPTSKVEPSAMFVYDLGFAIDDYDDDGLWC